MGTLKNQKKREKRVSFFSLLGVIALDYSGCAMVPGCSHLPSLNIFFYTLNIFYSTNHLTMTYKYTLRLNYYLLYLKSYYNNQVYPFLLLIFSFLDNI